MKILVRGANWIGDAVMTIPAMRELRQIFPDAQITLHTRSWAEGIFRDAEFIDEIRTFESYGSKFRTVLNEAGKLKTHKFDVAILFPNSFESAAIVRFAGIPKRFGYSKEGRRILLTDPIKIPDWKDERHQVYYYLNIVSESERRMLGTDTISSREPISELDVSPERRAEAWTMLIDAGIDPSRKTVAFGPGSTNSLAKRWGEEKFAELGGQLQKEFGANLVLLGSANEMGVSRQVAALGDADFIDLTGTTNLAEATAMLAEVDLFVSNDMGLAHIAAATGTKTLVIFGPTNEVTTRPFGPNAEVIRENVECSPCMLRECPIDHRCMTRIPAEKVFEKARAILVNE